MDYPDYFGFIFAIMGAFVATIAPEMLCGDRRENVLALYFSRAITRLDYVFAKLGAVAILTMTISLVPAVLLWLFRQLLADRPIASLRDNLDDLGKILLMGTLIALYLGCGGLMISSFTGRKSIATAIIFIGYAILEGFINALVEVVEGDRTKNLLALLSPIRLQSEMGEKLFGGYDPSMAGHSGFRWQVDAAFAVSVILIGILVMLWRYVPED
jgi:ABC-2 type transport system permease protein